MKNLNLCEILKGHEGETFYSPIAGDVKLLEIVHSCVLRIDCGTDNEMSDPFILSLYSDGSFRKEGECMLFPSEYNRDWNIWLEEQKPEAPKIPKTWSDYIIANRDNFDKGICDYCIDVSGTGNNGWTRRNTPIEKSALALLQIHQLIEAGYGGNITDEEWKNDSTKYLIIPLDNDSSFGQFDTSKTCYFIDKCHIAFHTKEQAEEFLKYPENIQLLKDYFMI